MGILNITMKYGLKFISKGASKLGLKSLSQKASIFENREKLGKEILNFMQNTAPRYVDDEVLDLTKILSKSKKIK